MSALAEFLAMGGRGGYVWGAYAVFVLVIVFNVVAPMLRYRAARRMIARHARRRERVAEGRKPR